MCAPYSFHTLDCQWERVFERLHRFVKEEKTKTQTVSHTKYHAHTTSEKMDTVKKEKKSVLLFFEKRNLSNIIIIEREREREGKENGISCFRFFSSFFFSFKFHTFVVRIGWRACVCILLIFIVIICILTKIDPIKENSLPDRRNIVSTWFFWFNFSFSPYTPEYLVLFEIRKRERDSTNYYQSCVCVCVVSVVIVNDSHIFEDIHHAIQTIGSSICNVQVAADLSNQLVVIVGSHACTWNEQMMCRHSSHRECLLVFGKFNSIIFHIIFIVLYGSQLFSDAPIMKYYTCKWIHFSNFPTGIHSLSLLYVTPTAVEMTLAPKQNLKFSLDVSLFNDNESTTTLEFRYDKQHPTRNHSN